MYHWSKPFGNLQNHCIFQGDKAVDDGLHLVHIMTIYVVKLWELKFLKYLLKKSVFLIRDYNLENLGVRGD